MEANAHRAIGRRFQNLPILRRVNALSSGPHPGSPRVREVAAGSESATRLPLLTRSQSSRRQLTRCKTTILLNHAIFNVPGFSLGAPDFGVV